MVTVSGDGEADQKIWVSPDYLDNLENPKVCLEL